MHKTSRTPIGLILALLSLPAFPLYPLSEGPAYYLSSHGWLPSAAPKLIYWPVEVVYETLPRRMQVSRTLNILDWIMRGTDDDVAEPALAYPDQAGWERLKQHRMANTVRPQCD
jgi:hypothetical protein